MPPPQLPPRKPRSVLQDWVMELPLREQGVLLTGIRGCDLAPKPANTAEETVERQLVGFLRWCVLNPADPREVGVKHAWFRPKPPDPGWKASMLGHFPQHWYSHVMHCFQVVGYRHPDEGISGEAMEIYHKLVHNMHLLPESFVTMRERLNEDRTVKGNVVS